MLLCETVVASGAIRRTLLELHEPGLVLRVEGAEGQVETLPLPDGAVRAVMARYARPVDESVQIDATDCLELGDGTLCAFRFRPRYDVIAKDYLAWLVDGQPACAELSISICAALIHLARAWRDRREAGSFEGPDTGARSYRHAGGG